MSSPGQATTYKWGLAEREGALGEDRLVARVVVASTGGLVCSPIRVRLPPRSLDHRARALPARTVADLMGGELELSYIARSSLRSLRMSGFSSCNIAYELSASENFPSV